MFIEQTDILKSIKPEELLEITRGDSAVINFGIDTAISEIKSYLRTKFDTDIIFSSQGTERNALLVDFAVDMAIYIIVASALPEQDLEDRRARYKRAIAWLKDARDGNLSPDLPLRQINNNNETIAGTFGMPKKRNNYF